MKMLLAPTTDAIKEERGRLSADVSPGSSVILPVESAEGVSSGNFVVIGYEGNELAEMCVVTGTTFNTVTVSTLKFYHQANEPFVVYRYNQRKFYGALTSDGIYSELTADGSPKDISVDDPQGTTLEYSGTTYAYFKATYYNSTTAEETDIGDSTAVSGDESTRYASIYGIRKHAGLSGNSRYSDLRLETKRRQAENEVNSVLSGTYELPLAEVPPLITQITELLAAGYIDFEEFGGEGQGVKWLGEARGLLKSIQKGAQLLIGADGTELATVETVGILGGYPNNAETDRAQFRMDQRF